jgi:RNA polymerase sigma-70 factor (ECF subfamily)
MTSEGAVYFPKILTEQVDVVLEQNSASVEGAKSQELLSRAAHLGTESDELLLSRIASGSREALGHLFRRHQRVVLNVASRILKDPSEAEDLCQEVFVSLFLKAKSFDASKGTAISWIIQIAYHRAMNRRQYLSHRQHYNAQEFDEEMTGVGRKPLILDELTARNLLNRLRGQLSESQRETLELHFFEGYSLAEIAEKTNQTLGNVRHHYYRGLERLRLNLFPQKDA